MCGELDDDVHLNAELHQRLLATARHAGVRPSGKATDPGPLAGADERGAFMEQLFAQGLARALDTVEGAAEDEKVDAIAAQAIALARLAGFLAGQLPPDADLYRAVIEAVSDGHAEPRETMAAIRAEMDHGHSHHDHSHGHHDHSHHHEH